MVMLLKLCSVTDSGMLCTLYCTVQTPWIVTPWLKDNWVHCDYNYYHILALTVIVTTTPLSILALVISRALTRAHCPVKVLLIRGLFCRGSKIMSNSFFAVMLVRLQFGMELPRFTAKTFYSTINIKNF